MVFIKVLFVVFNVVSCELICENLKLLNVGLVSLSVCLFNI